MNCLQKHRFGSVHFKKPHCRICLENCFIGAIAPPYLSITYSNQTQMGLCIPNTPLKRRFYHYNNDT